MALPAVLIPLIGPIIKKGAEILDKLIPDKDLAKKLDAAFQEELAAMDYSYLTKEIEARASIINTEATGHSWLQRNWRPITMLTFVYIVAHNYIFAPLFSLQSLPIPPDMWELLKLGIGGYIIGRTGEKMIRTWKG